MVLAIVIVFCIPFSNNDIFFNKEDYSVLNKGEADFASILEVE